MPLDNFTNFAVGTIADSSFSNSSTTFNLTTGQGSRFPISGSFNITLWNATDYPNPADAFHAGHAEIIRCSRSGDVLTATRGQEGTTAMSSTSGKTYKVIQGLTLKSMTDIAGTLEYLRNPATTLTDGATINMDSSQYFTARVTLGGTGRTLNINNMQAGQVYRVIILQDSTGSRTITTWNCYTGNGTGSITLKWAGGSAPTLTTTANKADIVTMLYADSTVWADCVKNF